MKKRESFAVFPDGSNASQWIYPVKETGKLLLSKRRDRVTKNGQKKEKNKCSYNVYYFKYSTFTLKIFQILNRMKLYCPIKSILSACVAYTAIGIGYTTEVQAQTAKVIKVKTDHSIARVQPNMWGVFFEDINLSADGGLYPELIRNRSFEDADTLQYWVFKG